jgi:hypothetical protein
MSNLLGREYGDFYLTDDLLSKWRAATDMTAPQINTDTKREIKTDDLFGNLYSEFIAQIRGLQRALQEDPVTIDNLCIYLHSYAIDWDVMQKIYTFHTKTLQTFNETTNDSMTKIKTLLDLRTNALSVHEKVKQARQAHNDTKKYEEQTETLENLMQEKQREFATLSHAMLSQGVKHRKFKHEFKGGEVVESFLNARLLSSRLARLNSVDDF